ncbi:MAG: 3-hydroxyisobutyrate dehydrogenase [Halobacteriovoraceae bacterium]|nr:3-hydroxyisobutyrate dehydrogenase [Halobacteriovoraceae bacterium]
MKIGFFGLGNMGNPMAINLTKAGFELTVYDIVKEAMLNLEKYSAQPSKSIEHACQNREVIISMLPSGEMAKELYLGNNGILQYAPQNCLLVDCSTIAPADSREISSSAENKGFTMIDAPVSGGVAGANAATLTFIVGGEKTAVDKATPILQKMGKNIFHAGGAGAGQTAKICNNMLLAIHMIGSSEAIRLGVENGLNAKTLSNILKNSSGDNWSLQKYNPCPDVMENVPANNNYQGGFSVDLMAKDLGLAEEARKKTGSVTPLGSLALELYRKHQKSGNGKLDFSSIFNALN